MNEPRGIGKKIVVIGDRVLVKPSEDRRTHSGLFLPVGVHESDGVRSGLVVARGPGVPIPSQAPDEDEPWKEPRRDGRYLPMQVEVGDFALFFKKAAVEVRYEGETYLVVPQSAVLVVFREGAE
ncbi:MAG: co-chaperone GroES [Planctomycetota bacterium]|nr:MAG: co-chaperone GroES [Planctomycetota bacterium]